MTNLKKIIALSTMLFTLGVAASSVPETVSAKTNYKSNVEILANLTNRSVQSLIDERLSTGKTYGTIANEAGKLSEFKAENLELKKDNINAKVESGVMSQERATLIIDRIEQNQATCDGTGNGSGNGVCDGTGSGAGNGICDGTGIGKTTSSGQGTGNGSGINKTTSPGQGINKTTKQTSGKGSGGQKLKDGSCYVSQ